jgi:BirA family biotin operon repressor/biotin-[acetyl-CoA-carboxylase] ligase
MSDPEPLPEELAVALRATTDRRGSTGVIVHFFSETTSTNDVAAALAERGAPAGTTVVAMAQSAGRGRFGRSWFSPPGAGLYVSVVCRGCDAAPLMTLAAGVALAEAIRNAAGLPVQIKWPNDIVVPGGSGGERPRKLAGILAEGSIGPDGVEFIVLGYGINMRRAAYPLDIAARATSLEVELGRPPDVGLVLAETLAALNARFAQLARGESASVLSRWRALAPSAHGAFVTCQALAGTISGVAEGIDDAGALLVRADGQLHRIIAGEID